MAKFRQLGLIQSFLKTIVSDLYEQIKSLTFIALCETLNLAKRPKYSLQPFNVAL